MLKVMTDRFFAVLITLLHALWVVFMLAGFFWTVSAFFFQRKFFDFFWFRSIHALGISLVSLLAVLDKYCPLTILEKYFRRQTGSAYEGGFILYYLERFIYPDINPVFIHTGTFIVAFVSIAIYVLRPPERTRLWLKRKFRRDGNAGGAGF